MSVLFSLAFETARLPIGLTHCTVFFRRRTEARLGFYYLLFIFLLFVNDSGVQPSVYNSSLLVLTWVVTQAWLKNDLEAKVKTDTCKNVSVA